MEEKIKPPIPKYKLSKSGIREFWHRLLRVLNAVLDFLSLRKKTQFWGIVYDSVSKQPLDPVIVKLLYVDTNKAETCVTDMKGRYGFLARPGKFKIFAKKTNYTFPSARVSGNDDGIYTNLYHGEFFELYGSEGEVLGPNIPMDPVGVDWNQQAKMKMAHDHPYVRLLGRRLVAVFFWFGFIYSWVYFWANSENPASALSIVYVYAIVFILRTITPPVRLWGEFGSHFAPEDIMLELHEPRFPTMVFGKSEVRADGKFFLRANPGKYELHVRLREAEAGSSSLGSCPVEISSEGVVNGSFTLKP